MLNGKKIVLGVSGGIAAYKMPMLVRLLKKSGAEVKVIMTANAAQFVAPLALAVTSGSEVLTEIFPAASIHNAELNWTQHISLGEWADAFVVAPATCNTLARLATGHCDDMLTAIYLSLRHGKPKLVFPSMDEEMFLAPAVQRNIGQLSGDGCTVFAPEHGELASGLVGMGRLPEPETIVEKIRAALELHDATQAARKIYTGKKVLITAGATREKIDDVRFISNYASGKMGFALASEAALQGAEVVLVTGKTFLPTPAAVTRIDVESADDMLRAVESHFDTCDVFIAAAAVADYRPAAAAAGKIKKSEAVFDLHLVRTPDILMQCGRRKSPSQLVIGFALEVQNAEDNARGKLAAKNLDLIVLNSADVAGAGFEVDTNIITLIARGGAIEKFPLMTKREAAGKILNRISRFFDED